MRVQWLCPLLTRNIVEGLVAGDVRYPNAMNFSRNFDNTDVRDIGHKSLWMSVNGRTLGIGGMSAHFQSTGAVPSYRLLLEIEHTVGGVNKDGGVVLEPVRHLFMADSFVCFYSR